jgi:membrane associated rhomboid family serine protease
VIIPIGDAPNPRGAPWLTYALIALNVAIFVLTAMPLSAVPADAHDPRYLAYVDALARAVPDPAELSQHLRSVSQYDLYVFEHGFRPASMSLEDLFTSMFLHGGLLHLAGNMLFLWIYGDNVEHRLGRLRFLVAYLATGVAATLTHTLLDPGSELPVVGASGAISGVLGFYFVWFPRNRVRLLWMIPPFMMQVMEVSARIVLGFYLVLDNLVPMLLTGTAGGVAHGAHIGGFVAGALAAVVGGRWSLWATPPDVAPPAEPVSLGALRKELDDGRDADAARVYFGLPARQRRGALDADESLRLARELEAEGSPEAALTMWREHIRQFPRGPGLAEAHARAGRLLLERLGQPTVAYQHFVAALEAGPSPDVAALVHDGLETIARLQKRRFVGRPRAA